MTFSISLHIFDHPLLSLNGWHYMWISGPIRSWNIFLIVLLCSLRAYCGGFISLQMTNCDFLSLPTLLDKLWQIDTKQRNSQIVLFLNWKFSIPAFIHLLASFQTQPIDLICDILGKSLWVGTAKELTLYNSSDKFIFSWLGSTNEVPYIVSEAMECRSEAKGLTSQTI